MNGSTLIMATPQMLRDISTMAVQTYIRETAHSPDELLTFRQAAKIVNKTPRTITNWVSRGRLKLQPCGKIRRADLVA